MNKHTNIQENSIKKVHPTSRQKPEIRDNLDSREGLEQETKGNDVTHNKKENKSEHLKNK